MDLTSLMIFTDVLVLGIGGIVMSFVIEVKERLIRIETKLNIDSRG